MPRKASKSSSHRLCLSLGCTISVVGLLCLVFETQRSLRVFVRLSACMIESKQSVFISSVSRSVMPYSYVINLFAPYAQGICCNQQ